MDPAGQTEALEDWYGRQWAGAGYPHHRGSGPVEEAMACLRMLARQFDLPFRHDVLRRVLADQLQRQAGEGLARARGGGRLTVLHASRGQLCRHSEGRDNWARPP